MKISKQQIEQFQTKNEELYKKAISNTLFSLENSDVYNIFKDEFENETKPVVVADFFFEERLTQLTGFDYFNTISYLTLLKDDKAVLKIVKHELSWENKEFSFIYSSAFTALFDSKQKVMRITELEEQLNEYQLELYKGFIGSLTKLAVNYYIPRLISLYTQFIDDQVDEELLYKKLKELGLEVKNKLTSQLTSSLNKILKEIYSKFGLNLDAKQATSSAKKIPFSDFDEDHMLFEANFDDEELALRTLGLDESATISEIKKAYKQLAMQYHPDRNKSEFAQEQMEKINNAYNLLKKHFN